MRNGVGFLEETDNLDMQNIPIAGHRVEGQESDLIISTVRLSVMKLNSLQETKHGYMKLKYSVDPSEVSVLDQTEGATQELTLITCEEYNPETLLFEKRLIVKAELVST